MEKSKLRVAPQAASPEDIDQIVKMVSDLSQWLKHKGIHQWSDPLPRNVLEAEIERGELFVLREVNRVIATLALIKDANEDAIDLHRLAIVRDKAGQKQGEALMEWAESEAKRRGVNALRLVCDSSNSVLSSYYQKLGYRPAGTQFHADWNITFVRLEKDLR